MKKWKSGFTLIELLVVIAIIGLLSTLTIIALNQARARSRDARRLADIKQIQTALEMYYSDTGSYPALISMADGNIATGAVVYMDIVPKPPTPADNSTCAGTTLYTYLATNINGAMNGSYTLQYCLGRDTNGVLSSINTATSAGIQSRKSMSCISNCTEKECGDDGCGRSCGICQVGNCVNGTCVYSCLPDCRGKNCGDDGCGGLCGDCRRGECVHGVCECFVHPDCTGKECGDDGCGGSCGDCREGKCIEGRCLF